MSTTNWSDPTVVAACIAAAATVVAAGAAVWYTVITKRLLKTTADNTAVTRAIFEAAQRPYVGVEEVRLHVKTPESASLLAKLKNHGTVPAYNMNVRMAVLLDSIGLADEQMKQRITLFPADDIHFHVLLHHESLPAFTTTFSGSTGVQRLNVKVWIEYDGPGGRRYSMNTEHHKNAQDSGFMLDHSSSD